MNRFRVRIILLSTNFVNLIVQGNTRERDLIPKLLIYKNTECLGQNIWVENNGKETKSNMKTKFIGSKSFRLPTRTN